MISLCLVLGDLIDSKECKHTQIHPLFPLHYRQFTALEPLLTIFYNRDTELGQQILTIKSVRGENLN